MLMLRHFQRQLLRVGKDVLVLDALDQQRIVDGRQPARLELHVDDRPDDLNDLARAHASAPLFIAAPRPAGPSPATACIAHCRSLARLGRGRPQLSLPCFRASAPPTMSSSSLVIFSWRALLNWIVRTSIISLAFFVAASIAVMRAPYSPASDSMRARNTWVRTCRGSSSSRIARGSGSKM